MSASLARRRRAARLAGAAVVGLTPALASSGARAQYAAGGGVPLGLPPAAVILNSPVGGMPNTLGQPGDLRYMPAVPAPSGPGVPPWSIVPSISLQELYNSNIFQSSSNPRGDFITAVTPSIQVTGATPRVTANLIYAPTFELYAKTRSADALAQQGIGSVTAELVPDTLFVTARALASVQPSGGGLGGLSGAGGFGSLSSSPIGNSFGPGASPGAVALGKNNRSQNFGASITPYVVHRFGDVGTAKAGVTLTESYISTNVTNPIPGTVAVGNQRQQTGEVTAQFLGGPDFGRVREFALVDASKSTGSGVVNGAHAATATNWIGYAVTRKVMPFGEFGAESIHYATVPATNINDGVWELGIVLTPNPDSQVSIGYGHHQGFTAADINGYYAVTARSRVSVSYTTALQTDIQQIESVLGLTNFDQFGNAVNADTGAPLFLGNGLLSTQNALFRTQTLSLSSITVLDRDTISFSVQHQNSTPVGSAAGNPAGTAEEATSFNGFWTHQISERTTLGVGGGYSLSNFQTASSPGTEHFISATAGASYLLTETLSTVARYSFFDRTSQFAGRSFTDNIFLVGLTKRF